MATTVRETTSRRGTPEEIAARKNDGDVLKTRFDSWVETLGGWDKIGMKSDIGKMASFLSKEHGDAPVEENSMNAWVSLWLQGKPLGPDALDALRDLDDYFTERKEIHPAYVELIRRANGMIILPEGVDWPFEIQLLPLSRLFADESYQRPVDDVWVRSMLVGFDERLVGAIDVSKRAGGKFAIMDGRQRFATMMQIGKKTCWCTVYAGMDVSAEADFFFRKNRQRKLMHYFYAFRARALSGDPTAKTIEEVVASTGYLLGAKPDENTITAVKSVEEIYELPTETSWGNALAPTLRTIRKCWQGRNLALDGSLMRGLGRFYSYYGPEDLQMKHFEERITEAGPVLILGRARDAKDSPLKNISSRIDIAAATTFAEIHNSGLPRADRINLDRIPKPAMQRARRGSRA